MREKKKGSGDIRNSFFFSLVSLKSEVKMAVVALSVSKMMRVSVENPDIP